MFFVSHVDEKGNPIIINKEWKISRINNDLEPNLRYSVAIGLTIAKGKHNFIPLDVYFTIDNDGKVIVEPSTKLNNIDELLECLNGKHKR